MFSFAAWLRERHPHLTEVSVDAVLQLAQEGGTVPFIARYRKERTGNLDEVAIGTILSEKETWDAIEKRKAFISEEIERQGKLTVELKEKIASLFDLDRLEDLYLPYKVQRKTKAETARLAGIAPLADWIWETGHGAVASEGMTLEKKAEAFVDEGRGVKDVASALDMARDILVERLAQDASLREFVRATMFEEGSLRTQRGEKAKTPSKFEMYFSYDEKVKNLLDPKNSHRYLAVRRGWLEEELRLSFGAPRDESGEAEKAWETKLASRFEAAACSTKGAPGEALLVRAARLAVRVYVVPSIETELHKALRDVADGAAIDVFANNLRTVLLASPYGAKAVLGVDPGIRTGCKLAVVDERGTYVTSDVIHLHSPKEREDAARTLAHFVSKYEISGVAVGNGTAGRETEAFVREALEKAGCSVPVVMVSEAGASVYSASEVAREEHPDLDLTVRGAISIARRFQDPLAELVKIDPKSIGVGQYQHDVSEVALRKSLERVVDSSVAAVGVNVNTASPYLLSRVAGIGPQLARAIVQHRAAKGLFRSRKELREVPRLSDSAFEQAAGFLRIPGGASALDETGIHPERYPALEALASRLGKGVDELVRDGAKAVESDVAFRREVGEFTFQDIVTELKKPGRDPRAVFEVVRFRDDVREIADLKPGFSCPGVVTNVTNFGAFVDIGVHQDGLVHVSQLADRFVKDPREVVKAGDRVTVRVLEVDLAKKRIALSMRSDGSRERASDAQAVRPRGEREAREASRRPMPKSSAPFKNDALSALAAFRTGAKAAASDDRRDRSA